LSRLMMRWSGQKTHICKLYNFSCDLLDILRAPADKCRTAFYENQRAQETAAKNIDFPKVSKPPFTLSESFANSPRRTHLAKAGGDTLPYCELRSCLIGLFSRSHDMSDLQPTSPKNHPQQTKSPLSNHSRSFFRHSVHISIPSIKRTKKTLLMETTRPILQLYPIHPSNSLISSSPISLKSSYRQTTPCGTKMTWRMGCT
jgi:hypothetical protein